MLLSHGIGILSSLPEAASKLQMNIAKLCETWWVKDLDGKQDIAIQTIVFMLNTALEPKATVSTFSLT